MTSPERVRAIVQAHLAASDDEEQRSEAERLAFIASIAKASRR